MKIGRLETFLVAPRWLFLRIETDDGVIGWGEPVIEGRADTVRAAVHDLEDVLIGADPLRIEDHWQVIAKGGYYRGGAVFSSALAGIDQALWDIAGKHRGAPIHELLGGPVRERVRTYTWIGGDAPAQVAEQAATQTEAGFSAVKMNATGRLNYIDTVGEVRRVVARAQEVRNVLGDERDFALDFHGRVSVPMAFWLLEELAPLRPMFVEEPVLPEHAHALPRLVEATTIPLACGERLYSRRDFLPALEAGVAIVQPDLSHAGGISEVRRIASLAEVFGAGIAPHCPLGPISLAASLQIAFATPNFVIQEQSIGIHYNGNSDLLDYLVDPSVFDFDEGHIRCPTRPGLGIDIDEDAVRTAAARGHRWRSPVWRHDDGSFAEW